MTETCGICHQPIHYPDGVNLSRQGQKRYGSKVVHQHCINEQICRRQAPDRQ